MKRIALMLLALAGPASALEAVAIRDYIVYPDEGSDALSDPSLVATSDSGYYVIDNERSLVFFAPNQQRRTITARPAGIASFEGRFAVADGERIRAFDVSGNELRNLVEPGARNISALRGMTTDERGNIYVVDEGREVVFVFSRDGVPLTVIGENGEEDAELADPVDVAVDGRGNIFIADAGNERIAVFSTGGVYLRQIPNLENPVAVASDSAGLVYVADGDGNRILRYDDTGRLLGSFGTKGRARGQFRKISDIEIGPDGLLRVLDSANRSLHILQWPIPAIATAPKVIPLSAEWMGVSPIEAKPIGAFFDGGIIAADDDGNVILLDSAMRELSRLQGFRDPAAAATNLVDRLYIADRGTGEVKVYSRSLEPLFTFGKGARIVLLRGGEGKLVSPRALAVSASGLVAVADKDKVEIFGPDGTFMATTGLNAPEEGQIEEPVGVAFGPDGSLFVADEENGCVLRYDATGAFTKQIRKLEPEALATDEEGRVYLLNGDGPRIKVFSSTLEPLLEIGTSGYSRGGIKGAVGLICTGDALVTGLPDGIARIALDLPLPAPSTPRIAGMMRALRVTWDPMPISAVDGYRVTIDTRSFETRDTGIMISGLEDEMRYCVNVEALNRFDRPGYPSAIVEAATLALLLDPPKTPLVRSSRDRLLFRWPALSSPYVVAYEIEAKRSDLFEKIATVPAGADTLEIELDAQAFRRFRIRAIADNGKEGPASPEAVYLAGEAFDALAAGGLAVAAEKFLAATSVEPENARVWNGLGEASERLERFSEAASAYARARELNPRDTPSAFGTARLTLLKGDSEIARNILADLGFSGATSDPEYLYLSGMIAMADEEYDTAVKLLAAAVSSNPSARNRDALAQSEQAKRLYGENRPRLEMIDAVINPIFPALYKTYSTEPIGAVTIRNAGRQALDRLRFSVFVRGAMDFPSDTVIQRLAPGETTRIAIRAELSNEILDVTEDEMKQAELRLTYYRSGEPVEVKQTVPFKLLARTALTWDDPRTIASFVTTRAPVVAEFARNIAGYTDDFLPGVNEPLARVMLLRHALAAYGLRYQEDPLNPFRDVSERQKVIDHVQLPEETLRNKAGDCDDLVVLFASLLENLGVRTAFADLPGHILLLIDSELPPEAAEQVALPGQWIERDGSVWIPVETTLFGERFEELLQSTAPLIPKASFIDLHSAWQLYPPVTTQSTQWRAALPDREETLRRFRPDDQAARIRRATALIGDEPDPIKVGIVYGKLGLLTEAENHFLTAGERADALNNLGNIAALRGDRAKAVEYYARAAALDPSDGEIQKNIERMK